MKKTIDDLNISDEDIRDCLLTNHKYPFDNGFEIFKIYNTTDTIGNIGAKIRRKYTHQEINAHLNYNEDGYKYETIYINIYQTLDYLFLKSKGYDVDSIL